MRLASRRRFTPAAGEGEGGEWGITPSMIPMKYRGEFLSVFFSFFFFFSNLPGVKWSGQHDVILPFNLIMTRREPVSPVGSIRDGTLWQTKATSSINERTFSGRSAVCLVG